jgi:hypothetical protein
MPDSQAATYTFRIRILGGKPWDRSTEYALAGTIPG